jgi:hypothetical protein
MNSGGGSGPPGPPLIYATASDPITHLQRIFLMWKLFIRDNTKLRSLCFGIMGRHDLFFNVGHTGPIKMNITC